MRIGKLTVLGLMLLLAACAENRVAVDNTGNGEYVEVSNPAYTMSPGAPATIWVPHRSADSGVPRGGEVLKKGYRSVVTEFKGSPEALTSSPGKSLKEQTRDEQFR